MNLLTTDAPQVARGLVVSGGTLLSTSTLTSAIETLERVRDEAVTVRLLTACAESTGGYVVIAPQLRYVPALIGSDGRPIPLYEFMEAVDGATDYDEIAQLFPLSYGQIAGAFSFLRRLAMTNPSGWDADVEEAAEEASDPAFIERLRHAFNDRGAIRVLNGE